MPIDAKIEILDDALFAEVLAQAERSARGRTNHNFHPSLEDNPQRFLNVMRRGTYVTPHRHLDPPKSETFVLLAGRLAFFVLDDGGAIARAIVLGAPGTGERCCGIDLGPGLWHTMVVLDEAAICFEVKPGPYAPGRDKDFAPFAPREGEPGCAAYQAELLARAGLAPAG